MAKEPERHLSSSPTVKHPDPKKHQFISFVKSGVRIAGCVIAIFAAPFHTVFAVGALAIFMAVAEVIGIYEELV